MANGVSSALGLKLPQTLVFDYPSVMAMAAYVHSLMAPAAATARAAIGPSVLDSRSMEKIIQVSTHRKLHFQVFCLDNITSGWKSLRM